MLAVGHVELVQFFDQFGVDVDLQEPISFEDDVEGLVSEEAAHFALVVVGVEFEAEEDVVFVCGPDVVFDQIVVLLDEFQVSRVVVHAVEQLFVFGLWFAWR